MKNIVLLFYVLVVIAQITSAQTVWSKSQGTMTFAKQANADWTQPANQDRISDSVWITRANSQSLFNIRKENSSNSSAPAGTLWAFGTTDSFETLTYKTFTSLSGNSPQSLIGKDLVLRLVAENIYLDIKILTFAGGNTGGAVSYTRAASILGNTSENVTLPAFFELKQNYPNPFNPSTTIGFTLQESGVTSLKIYDAIGREVATLINNEYHEAGVYHQKTFDASKFSSGIYFARLNSTGKTQMRRMILMK